MIMFGMVAIGKFLISLIFSAFEMIALPVDLISTLYNILCYGSWVVGSDVLLLFVGSVTFWWSVKFSVGLAIWIYEHLPLT